MSAPEGITKVSELMEALKEMPGDARIIVTCMDGADTIWITYEEQFNYVMVAG